MTNAIIKLNVPDFQIGKDVTVYFKDTMMKKGKCEPEMMTEKYIEGGGSTWWYACSECGSSVNNSDKYCHECGRRFKDG